MLEGDLPLDISGLAGIGEGLAGGAPLLAVKERMLVDGDVTAEYICNSRAGSQDG